jgi:hypothetical protein
MAAGLGFKTFSTGDVLSATDVNGYLMQGILVFASATARDAAITAPAEGQFAYLKDTNVTTYYTGSAWANVDTTGMTNPMTTTGDTIYSSSGSTPARLGIGSTGDVLTVAAGVPSWAAPAGGGGMTQLATGSLSGSSISITSIPTGYRHLEFVVVAYRPANDSASSFIRFNNDTANNYRPMGTVVTDTGTFYDNLITIGGAQDNGTGNSLIVATIPYYDNTSSWKFIYADAIVNNSTTATSVDYGRRVGVWNGTAAVDRIDYSPSSGNFTSGTYYLYGVK